MIDSSLSKPQTQSLEQEGGGRWVSLGKSRIGVVPEDIETVAIWNGVDNLGWFLIKQVRLDAVSDTGTHSRVHPYCSAERGIWPVAALITKRILS